MGAARYEPVVLDFLTRSLRDDLVLGVSETGDYTFFRANELEQIVREPASLPFERRLHLQARRFLRSGAEQPGQERLAASRRAMKRETQRGGVSLHIIVPTLQCAHSCQYCQVSRRLEDEGSAMSVETLDAACSTIFEGDEQRLTVEFQGGDPLLRFDLVRRAVERIAAINRHEGRTLRIVVASTLHQLDEEMCDFFAAHKVYLSTSIDGPESLHNRNRPTPAHDAHERTVRGIGLARSRIGANSVAALMTATRASLDVPEEIVDEYVRLGFKEIFVRPLSFYGFARRNQAAQAYSVQRFLEFYERVLARIEYWDGRGVELREVYTSLLLNKFLSAFDAGYVDLQSPTSAGKNVLVYNYDGYIYPSDEARMLAESGDQSLRLGRIGDPLKSITHSPVARALQRNSDVDADDSCRSCTYKLFCGPNPVDAQAQLGRFSQRSEETEHCRRHRRLFDRTALAIHAASDAQLRRMYSWARPGYEGPL